MADDKFFDVLSGKSAPDARCSSCKKELQAHANFCSNCGNPIRKAVTPRVEKRLKPENVKICPECNQTNDMLAWQCCQCQVPFGQHSLKESSEEFKKFEFPEPTNQGKPH